MAANKHQAEAYAPDPHGWYREPVGCVEQLFRVRTPSGDPLFGNARIWDPACGVGNILDVAKRRGHATLGSDIVQRGARHQFFRGNFLHATRFPTSDDLPLAIVTNPPFNTPPGIALRFILKTIEEVPFWRAAFLVPIEFACGQGRYRDLFAKHPPSHVCFLSQRPSMPPGTAVGDLGDDAFKGGKADFVWIIWTDGGPYRTECLWLAPDGDDRDPIERRKRR